MAWLGDGRVLSGGMDGALWLWPAAGASGSEVKGHAGPVSQVRHAYGITWEFQVP